MDKVTVQPRRSRFLVYFIPTGLWSFVCRESTDCIASPTGGRLGVVAGVALKQHREVGLICSNCLPRNLNELSNDRPTRARTCALSSVLSTQKRCRILHYVRSERVRLGWKTAAKHLKVLLHYFNQPLDGFQADRSSSNSFVTITHMRSCFIAFTHESSICKFWSRFSRSCLRFYKYIFT